MWKKGGVLFKPDEGEIIIPLISSAPGGLLIYYRLRGCGVVFFCRMQKTYGYYLHQ